MLETQIQLEKDMLNAGIERYQRGVQAAQCDNKESRTSYSCRLLPEFVTVLADAIEDHKHMCNRGKRGAILFLIKDLDANKAAVITLKVVLDSLIRGDFATRIVNEVGMRIEDEIRMTKFSEDHAGYYEAILEDFKRKNTTAYRHIHRVLSAKAKEKEDGWVTWSIKERASIGAHLLDLTIRATGLIQKFTITEKGKKKRTIIQPTPETEEWVKEHISEMEMLTPDFCPTIIPPRDWVAQDEGGYYTPELQRRLPFIKIKDKFHRKAIAHHDYTVHMQGVSAMQRTAWKVNKDVHNVLKEVYRTGLSVGVPSSEPLVPSPSPFADRDIKTLNEAEKVDFKAWKRAAAVTYTMEKERFSKILSLARSMTLAKKYVDYSEFYFVYNCDFRGRVYCATSGLSPQGADFSKALLVFANSVPLGKTGGMHLAIHGANMYGEDKISYDDRVKWVQEREHIIRLCATQPLDSSSIQFWGAADKPYQFLAFCFEYDRYVLSGYSEDYKSNLQIAADGSCNGLQNFSALLRDKVGGKATNLLPSAAPEDIYSEVADVVTKKLKELMVTQPNKLVEGWLAIGVDRKITKKSVMTLPYGSTLSSCTESVEEWLMAHREQHQWVGAELMKAARFLSKVIWEAIGEVVIAAKDAMHWLQKAARAAGKHNFPLIWTSPTGFKVYQGSRQIDVIEVTTQLCGRCRISLGEPNDQINTYRQANGAAPNFVHSIDAAHMIRTILSTSAEGLTDFAMIHDDFGTHAGNMDKLHRAIRESFVEMHEVPWLEHFKNQHSVGFPFKFPELPPMGELDLKDVLNSPYFFG